MTSQTCEQKFCIQCKHIATNSSREWEKYRCFAPQNIFRLNLVTSEKEYLTPFCIDQRKDIISPDYTEYCGTNAKWFEEKLLASAAPTLVNNESFNPIDLDTIADAAAKRVAALKSKSKKLSTSDLDNL